MLPEIFHQYSYILASRSPRRQFLLKELGFDFDILVKEVEEAHPAHLRAEEIALYLSDLKSSAFTERELEPSKLLITADTIVWHQDRLLGKPESQEDAFRILSLLSGSMHEVYTGITLRTSQKMHHFFDVSKVWFKPLSAQQLNHYIEHYRPYDKAGAYGVQEWIGYVAVEKIEGSFFNVMGFPTHRFYQELEEFIG